MSNSVAHSSPALEPGSVLAGKYRVVRRIGEGGMGVVLEAEHVLSGKRVAIKWLQPAMASRLDAAERMLREARASARVRHPNVVDVYDVLQDGEAVFLVMELLEGEPLSALLERGGIPVYALIGLLTQAMQGVAAAHKQGVVHRDIKPDNIFLARHPDRDAPTPKVLDFGISKLLDGDGPQLTRSGVTLGTPLYMSYEQLCGERDIDGRADVYAFGVILYEALTGQSPFEAQTLSELIVKITTTQPIPPKTLCPELPTALDRVVQRAVAKDRDQRTASLEALIRELGPFASQRAFRAQMTTSHARLPAVRPRSDQPAGAIGATASRPVQASAGRDAAWGHARTGRKLRLGSVLAFTCVGLSALAALGWYWYAASQRTMPSQVPTPARAATLAPVAPAPQPVTETAAPTPLPGPLPALVRKPEPAAKARKKPAMPALEEPRSAPSFVEPKPPASVEPVPRLRAGRPRRQDF